jgi:uncharacterized protein (TIGR02466 family)
MLDSQIRYTNVFATPLITHVLQDAAELNPCLRERILTRESETRGIGKSNQGGWHSETGQLEFCDDAGRRLIGHMRQLAEEATQRVFAERNEQAPPYRWTLSAWANVNRNGHFNKTHVHPGSTWSGTYYVEPGEPTEAERGTVLHLIDPCQGRSMTFLTALPSSVHIHPKPGLIVLFPSYVPHMVFPHNGRGPRISIAFNLRAEPYP